MEIWFQPGSHLLLKHPSFGKEVWVAVHANEDAGRLGNRILREAGVQCPRGRLLGRILQHDWQHSRFRHGASECASPSHASRSTGRTSPQRPSDRTAHAACRSASTARSQAAVRFQVAQFRLTSLRSDLSRRLSAEALMNPEARRRTVTARSELRLASPDNAHVTRTPIRRSGLNSDSA